MEDSFKLRVDKIFGSLSSSSSSPSPNVSSLWSLTDEEVERKEWNRVREESPEPEPQMFFANRREKKPDEFSIKPEKDILDMDDDVDGADDDDDDRQARDARGSSSKSVKGDDYNDEEWEIKSNIGLDCTLDNEEEEDGYDKVAVGKEDVGDRLYMKDINDYVTIDSCNEIPSSLKVVTKDPRANHIAAKIRLKEDEETARKTDSSRVSVMDSQTNTIEDVNLKSILKRDTQPDSRPQKRVRFDSECKEDFDAKTEEEEEDMVSSVTFTVPPDYPSGIPDYMRNPSKYTRYTFDSDDVDEKSNKQAYMNFRTMIKKSNSTESEPDDVSGELPKSVTFIPKKKTGDTTMAENDTKSKQNQNDTSKESRRGLGIGIVEDDEVCSMDVDEPETTADKITGARRSGRQYRMKPKSELD